MSEPNHKYLSLPGDYGVLNPRSHSRVLWLLMYGFDIDLQWHMYYRGADFSDAVDAYVDIHAPQEILPQCVWGRLIARDDCAEILKRVDDLIEAEDAHISESPS